LSKALKFH